MGTLMLPDRIARQASRTPDATALVDGARTVTYRELDEAVARACHRLRGLGAEPDRPVGIALERGVDLVVTLLAAWRAGAGYLPLDPGQPAARLRELIRDSGVALVVAGDALAPTVRAAGAVPLAPAELVAVPAAPLPQPASPAPEQLAYAVFTSGSTGRPKLVGVTHAGLAGRVGWTVDTHALGPADRVLAKTSIGFDAAAWELLAPLTCGAAVVLAPPGTERDPAALLSTVAAHRVTVLQVVPSVLRPLVEEDGWSRCDELRLVFSAGEPLQAELATRLRARTGPAVALWNTYGPTECSIDVTAHPVDPAQTTGPVPIGRPIRGMRVLVLDPAGDPVPVGVPGELYAGGPGVARGYLGRPGLTAQRFVPDPYGEPGARLYRTGDQVRWRPDHTLEYLGRLDQQLKVNGVRIEPGEVESALAAHPEVTGAVVTAFTAPGTVGTFLAAHVTLRTPVPAGELRAFLAERLPESHLPSVVRLVPDFPLTASGKADRSALRAAAELEGPGRPRYLAPRDRAEEVVAEVWAGLLGVDRIGADDDFFALGGTSLQLTRLAARLRAAAGGPVPLRGLFEAATVAEQARLITLAAPADDPVTPIPRDGELPLAPGQRRLWFLDRLHPADQEWVAPLLVRLPAATGEAAVRQALRRLAERHEPLRTRYTAEAGEPRQLIGPAEDVELRVEDTTREQLPALFGEQFRRGFDLERGPVWRALLARIDGEDHLLLLTLHHISCDGASTVVLERELRELCAAHREGRESTLAAPAVQYADWAAWSARRLADRHVSAELDYWQRVLADLPTLDLPTDRPRPAERDGRGAVVRFRLQPELADRLTDLGRAHGATPFATLLTGFATLLARHTGQWDLPVGTPVSGRTRPEVEDAVGFFLNSLVLRCRPDGRAGFAAALDGVRDTAREAFAHQELPFERLVEALGPERDLSRTPLYQVAFDLHTEGATGLADRDEDMAAFAESWRVAKTDLSLFLRRRSDGGYDGVLEYATALFDEATVARLAERFVRLLTAAVDHPRLPLEALDLQSPAELHRQLVEWNDTGAGGTPATVPARFEEQARRTPAAPAVILGERVLGYAELDAAANRLARQLRAAGVADHDRVAAVLPRGPELLTALLAVWKAGAAYVPVDPADPVERIAEVLRSSGAAAWITTGATGRIDHPAAVRLDTDAAAIAGQPGTAPERVEDPARLAYVIFTSGSTGRPKGVEITHRGLADHVDWAATELVARGSGGAPLFSSHAFDLVVPNLWAPLVAGQPVRLFPPDADLSQLGSWLARTGPYSFVKLTPGHLDIIAAQLTAEQAAALAPVLVVAGEPFTPEVLARWRALAPHTELINEYGPTEATVGATIHPVPADPPTGVLPIGRPLPHTTVYLLDRALRPVPPGAAGELCVGGRRLARGYTGRPGLTAERFVPDPYGEAGARLYRTGDLARQLPDGTVEFLGRMDDQTKLRGYRIEPTEARAVLAGHLAVREAAVLVHRPTAGEPHLAAYYLPADPAAPPAERDLAEHCARRLPHYLVPASFTALDAFPLTANGKLDRRALPAPGRTPGDPAARTAPSGPVQLRIAALWAGIVGSEPDAHADFFLTGGNSITAIRLIAAVHEEFGIVLPVRAVFEAPTVAGLAATVEEIVRAEAALLSDDEIAAAL
ncbi:amino acid adenylation domain-containing protein [Kitasatospora sp. NPDC056651]|uniref:amino acid adenylation domain-containing protein n=1 Tax=Kitasatospora sp. NPDC056651 TaxID=3345892 RepID=UPI0036819A32